MDITLNQANEIIASALQRAAAAGYQPMAVVVLDASGHIRSAQRQDGASMFRIDIATGKAWASIALGAASRVLTQRAKDLPAFFSALASTGNGKFIPQTGAVLIKDAAGQVIGAAGASGGTGDEDEAVCIAGIAAVGLQAG
ncbi:MAG: heme-binding protein [Pseudomonadota bacterium]|nr:heme-binding protein [Pseudomonadota bacterium]